jgi:hypothetical protein
MLLCGLDVAGEESLLWSLGPGTFIVVVIVVLIAVGSMNATKDPYDQSFPGEIVLCTLL